MTHSAHKAQSTLLIAEEFTVQAKYSDFTDVFLKESAEMLPKNTGINKHAIELERGKQPIYEPIYSLGPVELKTFKTYIKTNLANDFIRFFKSPTVALIFFICKTDGSFYMCINYYGLNNLTIKNQYQLLLIEESLDWLGQAKPFRQFDLTSAYH